MKRNKTVFLFLLLLVFLSIQNSFGQQNKATFIRANPNTYAPSIYSNKINLQIMLVNLPGASLKESAYQGSYKIYFVPEGEVEKLVQSRGGTINELKVTDITNKILLSNGSFNKSQLASDRVFEKIGVPFKQKIPDKLKTMLGSIVIFYTLKIYDARLKKNIYKDSSFQYFPFERGNTSEARRTFHLSFYVNEDGKLYTSSLPRDKTIATW